MGIKSGVYKVTDRQKVYAGFIAILALFAVSFWIADNDAWNAITGRATTTTVSVTINSAPIIHFVSNVTAVSIVEGVYRQVNFSFLANDSDGRGDLDNTTAQLRANTSGEDIRANNSCTPVGTVVTWLGTTSNSINYSCTIYMAYFDGPGFWNINVSIEDVSNINGSNASISFQLLSTTAIAIGPTALTWPTLELGQLNQTSNNDPITVNNTGNKDINTSGITITGYDLRGLITTTDFIKAQNFSVTALNSSSSSCSGTECRECNGTIMFNATAEPQVIANMTAGNNSLNYMNQTSGQENLYFCLMTVPSDIARQTYDTSQAGTSTWTIGAS